MAYAAIFRNCTISISYRAVTKTTSRKRDVIVRALNEQLHDKISFSNPTGGIYIWGKLKEPINEKQLIIQSLKQEIAFMPGSIFGAKDGYIRLSYGKVDIDQIEEGISRLRSYFSLWKITLHKAFSFDKRKIYHYHQHEPSYRSDKNENLR